MQARLTTEQIDICNAAAKNSGLKQKTITFGKDDPRQIFFGKDAISFWLISSENQIKEYALKFQQKYQEIHSADPNDILFYECLFDFENINFTQDKYSTATLEHCMIGNRPARHKILNLHQATSCFFSSKIEWLLGAAPVDIEVVNSEFQDSVTIANAHSQNVIAKNCAFKSNLSWTVDASKKLFLSASQVGRLNLEGNTRTLIHDCKIAHLNVSPKCQDLRVEYTTVEYSRFSGTIHGEAIFTNVEFLSPPEVGEIAFTSKNVSFLEIKFPVVFSKDNSQRG